MKKELLLKFWVLKFIIMLNRTMYLYLKIRIIFLQAFYNRFNYASNLFVDYYDYENVSRETFIR